MKMLVQPSQILQITKTNVRLEQYTITFIQKILFLLILDDNFRFVTVVSPVRVIDILRSKAWFFLQLTFFVDLLCWSCIVMLIVTTVDDDTHSLRSRKEYDMFSPIRILVTTTFFGTVSLVVYCLHIHDREQFPLQLKRKRLAYVIVHFIKFLLWFIKVKLHMFIMDVLQGHVIKYPYLNL